MPGAAVLLLKMGDRNTATWGMAKELQMSTASRVCSILLFESLRTSVANVMRPWLTH